MCVLEHVRLICFMWGHRCCCRTLGAKMLANVEDEGSLYEIIHVAFSKNHSGLTLVSSLGTHVRHLFPFNFRTNNRLMQSASSQSVQTVTNCCNCTVCTSKPPLVTTRPLSLDSLTSRLRLSGRLGPNTRVSPLRRLRASTLLWSTN